MVITVVVYAALGLVLARRPEGEVSSAGAAFLRVAPTVIAAVNATALVFLLRGWRAVRARHIAAHRRAMLAAAGCIALFLLLYVMRVALGGTKAFAGPAAMRTFIYLPVLAVHIVLSIVSVPLVVHNLLVGLTRPAGEVARTAHPLLGRWAVLLWSLSLSLGLLVYLLLNVLY